MERSKGSRTGLALIAAALALAAGAASAASTEAYSIARVFTSKAVLQRDRPICVWGRGTTGQGVAMTLKNGATTLGGVPAWSEYVAGTDPADSKSRFIATIDVRDGKVNLSWEPPNPAERWADDAHFYSVLGAETLEGDVKWEPADTLRHHFFKIGIDVRPH